MSQMNIAFVNLSLLIYLAFMLITSRKYLHMLQLNSYMNSRFLKWFLINYKKDIKPIGVLLVVPLLFLWWKNLLIFSITWICVNFIFLYNYQKTKASEKKKFVITNRIKRLYVTIASLLILSLLIVNLVYFSDKDSWGLVIFISVIILVEEINIFLTLIANILNYPLENVINRFYVIDAKRFLNQHDQLIVIGITGSYGKTSSKFILSRIFSEKYNVLMTPESYNTLMGVVRTVRELLKPTHEIFVVEMGAKKKGDIRKICQLVKPKYGLLTSIGPQHLDTFKSFENIIETKFELVDSLPENGVAFLNFNNDAIRKRKTEKRIISYGIENDKLNYWAENIYYDSSGLSFSLYTYKNEKMVIKTRLLGLHNVLNILGACSMALEMGMKVNDICYAVKQLSPIPHRLELKSQSTGVTIIDDAFNSNPEGANEALNVLNKFNHSTKILITPGLVELGEREYECNYSLGVKAASVCDYIVLVGNKRSKPMMDALIENNFDNQKVFVVKNLNEAMEKLKSITILDSVILFENDLPDNYEE